MRRRVFVDQIQREHPVVHSWRVFDGPLEGEIFAMDANRGELFHFRLESGRTAVYRAVRRILEDGEWRETSSKNPPVVRHLVFVGIDPFADDATSAYFGDWLDPLDP